MKEEDIIEKAKELGYRSGTLIDYESKGFPGTDTLGDGEFAFKGGRLIKYEKQLQHDNPSFRRHDTIWSEKNGWTKIVTKKHGFSI